MARVTAKAKLVGLNSRRKISRTLLRERPFEDMSSGRRAGAREREIARVYVRITTLRGSIELEPLPRGDMRDGEEGLRGPSMDASRDLGLAKQSI